MCGIVGIVGHTFAEQDLRRAVDSLYHRGPDGSGIFIEADQSIGLGHSRLSVIDLETGAQPLYAQDRNLVLVANGEIYDFERIRSDLQARGHVFCSRSDSEIILHLYQQYGMAFTEHLRGEFAFLLYDKQKHAVFAVRDRFGIKPLFYHHRGGKYLFGSEAKALFATGLLQPSIDAVAVRDQLSSVVPDSIFAGVNAVPPGCILKVDVARGSHRILRYWEPNLPLDRDMTNGDTLQRHIGRVKEQFDEAVRLRLRSDVPVGVYLSGGIDSAAVAATAAKYHRGTLKTFTVSFPDGQDFDESQLAKNMARKIGAEFHSITCDRQSLLQNTEDCLWYSELPFSNFHGVGKLLLSRLAHRHVKVVLTGEGADEVFLGYVYFQPGRSSISRQMENRFKKSKRPRGPHVREIVEALGFLPVQEHGEVFARSQQKFLTGLFHHQQRPRLERCHPLDRLTALLPRAQTEGRPLTRQIQYYSIRAVLAPYILSMLGDRQEMAHSLEGRTPFLDHHLFHVARQIPDQFKICNDVEKYILREAFRAQMTEEIYQRSKWPYSAPPVWIKRRSFPALDHLLDTYLSKEAIDKAGIFDSQTIGRLRQWSKLLIWDSDLKRRLNRLFTVLLTVQILEHHFVQDFRANLQKRRSSG